METLGKLEAVSSEEPPAAARAFEPSAPVEPLAAWDVHGGGLDKGVCVKTPNPKPETLNAYRMGFSIVVHLRFKSS